MAKKPDHPLLSSRIQRLEIGDVQPDKAEETSEYSRADGFAWDEYSSEEGLEDTPVAAAQLTMPASSSKSAADEVRNENTAERGKHRAKAAGKHASDKGSGRQERDISRALTAAQKKSKANEAALDFADNPNVLDERAEETGKY